MDTSYLTPFCRFCLPKNHSENGLELKQGHLERPSYDTPIADPVAALVAALIVASVAALIIASVAALIAASFVASVAASVALPQPCYFFSSRYVTCSERRVKPRAAYKAIAQPVEHNTIITS